MAVKAAIGVEKQAIRAQFSFFQQHTELLKEGLNPEQVRVIAGLGAAQASITPWLSTINSVFVVRAALRP